MACIRWKDETRERWLEKRINRNAPNGCWEWTGGHDGRGYGVVRWLGQKEDRTHRFMYARVHGPIAEGIVIRHTCDNPPCMNPDHLVCGTDADNVQDRILRGRSRHPTGEAHGSAKLTAAKVREIRKRYIPYHPVHGQTALGREFGVSQVAIKNIVLNYTWKYIDGAETMNVSAVHGSSELTPAQAQEIRAKYVVKGRKSNLFSLAREFGVSLDTIRMLVTMRPCS